MAPFPVEKNPCVITKLRIKIKCYTIGHISGISLPFRFWLNISDVSLYVCMCNELFVTKLAVAHTFCPKMLSTLKRA